MLGLFGSNWKAGGIVAGAIAAAVLGTSTAAAADDVRVRFSWKMKGEYAHLYMADAIGAYKERDLNVIMGEGAGSQAALGALIQGQEDVVIMPAIFAISAIQKGMPVKIIALYHPRTPVVIISQPEKPITSPADLQGKTVAHAVGETGTSYLKTFCAVNKVDCSEMNLVTVNAQSRVPQFLQGQFDAVSVYRSNDLPIIQAETGKEYPVLDLAEHGLAAPGLAAVSSEATIAEKPDVLRRYLAAVAEGIEATKADPAKAVEAIKAVWPAGPDNAIVQKQVEATMAAVPESDGKPIGWVDVKDIEAALEFVKTEEGFGEPKPAETYFTNELLEQ